MKEILMPKLGMAQKWCVIEKWHKKEGEAIKNGDVLVEVSTDKINFEVESKYSGVVLKILREEKEEVPVGEVIAYIGDKNEKIPGTNEEKEEIPKSSGNAEEAEDEKIMKVSALAKKIAEKNKIDISKIKGSGPGGRIMKEDVVEYMESIKPADERDKEDLKTVKFSQSKMKISQETPLSSMRKTISEKMVYSKQNIPHIGQSTRVDVTKLVELKDKIKPFYDKLSITDFIIKMTSKALREDLSLNSSLLNDRHIVYEDINIGLVVSVPGGLFIPTIYDCDKLTIFEIANKRRELLDKTKQNRLEMDEVSNGTFTITNLGTFNVRSFTAIIYPPQSSILSVGAIYTGPNIDENGNIEARKFLELSVFVDHRILDGADGAKFLTRLADLLENPEKISF